MNRIASFAVALLISPAAFSQSAAPSDAFINARQVQVERIAETLYSTRLNSSAWSRHTLQRCAAFTHHSFATFDPTPKRGVRFVAIYDVDHAAARSADKPWEGGVTLLKLKTRSNAYGGVDPSQDALLSAFNRAVSEENVAHGSSMDLADEAVCFITLQGEEPALITPQVPPQEVHSAPPVKISSILIPLASSPGMRRTASLEFGPSGAIARVSLTEQRHP